MLWSTTDEVADDEGLNAGYQAMKEGGNLLISSGFRAWTSM